MKQKAVIIDLDGTLVDNHARVDNIVKEHGLPARWDSVFKDTDKLDMPAPWCMEIVKSMSKSGYKIIFLTGRSATDTTKPATQRWINNYVPLDVDYELIMRLKNDYRGNAIVKMEIMNTKILPFYDVLFAIDDMKVNVDMFRNMGITALHCSDFIGG